MWYNQEMNDDEWMDHILFVNIQIKRLVRTLIFHNVELYCLCRNFVTDNCLQSTMLLLTSINHNNSPITDYLFYILTHQIETH